jgi:1-acyl-sn-glycerol-3-phosphate acyltransferase
MSTATAALPLPHERRWPWLFRLFTRHAKRYLRRNFHAVRLARGGPVPQLGDGPIIVVVNHPSWWDPLVGLVIAERFGDRQHYAPMESAALRKYRFFERLGFFGVQRGTVQGARDFLRIATALLALPRAMLWITAQGHFADVRQRPPGLRPGVAHLVRRLAGVTVLPLALEYVFWTERHPEALARFGAPLVVRDGKDHDADTWLRHIEDGLAATQDALAAEALRRDPALFETLLGGRAGVGGVYDWWRRVRAWLRGRRFRPEHDETHAEGSHA